MDQGIGAFYKLRWGCGIRQGSRSHLHDPSDDENPETHIRTSGGLSEKGGYQERQAAHGELEEEEGEEDEAERVPQKEVELWDTPRSSSAML